MSNALSPVHPSASENQLTLPEYRKFLQAVILIAPTGRTCSGVGGGATLYEYRDAQDIRGWHIARDLYPHFVNIGAWNRTVWETRFKGTELDMSNGITGQVG